MTHRSRLLTTQQLVPSLFGSVALVAVFLGACSSDEGNPGTEPDPMASATVPGMPTEMVDPPPVPTTGLTPDLCDGDGVFPGRTPLRRLTRTEYDNSVADLLGADVFVDGKPPSEGLVADTASGGFVNNADVVSTSLRHVQGFYDTANALADSASAKGKFTLPCAATGAACAEEYIRNFGRRAFRRPLAEEEVASYMARFNEGLTGGSFEEGLAWVVGRMLQSPHFLYRVELETAGAAPNSVKALNGYSIATRLSYFLWQTTPDENLLNSAASGALDTKEGVAAAVDQMIQSDRFAETLRSFHDQWLDVELVLGKSKVAGDTIEPKWDGDLKLDLVEEIERFTREVYTSGGSYTDLLTANWAFLTPRLAALYGAVHPNPAAAEEWAKVTVPNRHGMLTMAGFTAAHSSEIQSNPVKRGAWLRSQVLCGALPPPPPDFTPTEPVKVAGETTADAFRRHREDPACAGCHVLIDPLGMPFEHYDEFGRYRDMDNGVPVSAEGEFTETSAAGTKFQGAEAFATGLTKLPEAQACLVNNWFRYGMGRTEEAKGGDLCTINRQLKRFGASNQNLKDLIVGLATSDAFRFRLEQ